MDSKKAAKAEQVAEQKAEKKAAREAKKAAKAEQVAEQKAEKKAAREAKKAAKAEQVAEQKAEKKAAREAKKAAKAEQVAEQKAEKKAAREAAKLQRSITNSETAKNGYKEEELVCKDLNSGLLDAFAPILGNNYNECNRIKGNHKCDIQSDNKILRGQVKKYKKGRFQQLDRHWISKLTEDIPELKDHLQIMEDLIECKLLPNGTHVVKPISRKTLSTLNYPQEKLDNFLDLLNKYKKQILEYAFLGSNSEMQPDYLIGVEYKDKERNKIIVFKIIEIIDYLKTLKFQISPKKTCIYLGSKGTISLQRKGGDSGKKSSNQLQIKLILSNLTDKVTNLEYVIL